MASGTASRIASKKRLVVLILSLLQGGTLQSLEFRLGAEYLSDYSLHGISQSDGQSAYHLSLGFDQINAQPIQILADLYSIEHASSNHDATRELDLQVNLTLNGTDDIDVFLAQTWRTYQGTNNSHPNGYFEWVLGFQYQKDTHLYSYYSHNTLSTTGARNLTLELRHRIPFATLSTDFYLGRVSSLDPEKLRWDDDERYLFFGLKLSKSWPRWHLGLSAEGTSLNARAEPSLKGRGERKLILDIGWHFSSAPMAF